MPRQTLIPRQDGRYSCKYSDKYFYGKTPAEALHKRDEYIKECTRGYDPDYNRIPFLDYGLEWLNVYRTGCNRKMRQQYKNMIEYAAASIPKTTQSAQSTHRTYSACIIRWLADPTVISPSSAVQSGESSGRPYRTV